MACNDIESVKQRTCYVTDRLGQMISKGENEDVEFDGQEKPSLAKIAKMKMWEAEAERMTANSYANEPENVYVKKYISNGDGTFTAIPTTEYSAYHWKQKAHNITVSDSEANGIDVSDYTNASGDTYIEDTVQISLNNLSDATSVIEEDLLAQVVENTYKISILEGVH